MSPTTFSSPVHWALRRLIRTGSRPGLLGSVGRLVGRTWGSPIPGGYHFIVRSPGEAIQSLMLVNGLYEPTTCSLVHDLVRSGRRMVYDVGANAGQHTLVAIAAGAKVVAFEPVPRLAAAIRDNLRRNRVVDRCMIAPLAVCDREGEATFHVATRSDDCSHSLLPGVEASHIDVIQVRTTTLDAFVRAHPTLRPTLVKVDVEGAEALALDGAKSLLEGPDRPDWIVETSDTLSRGVGQSAVQVLLRLQSRGYRLLRIHEAPAGLTEVTPSSDVSRIANYLALSGHRAFPSFEPSNERSGNGWFG